MMVVDKEGEAGNPIKDLKQKRNKSELESRQEDKEILRQ